MISNVRRAKVIAHMIANASLYDSENGGGYFRGMRTFGTSTPHTDTDTAIVLTHTIEGAASAEVYDLDGTYVNVADEVTNAAWSDEGDGTGDGVITPKVFVRKDSDTQISVFTNIEQGLIAIR